MKHTPGPWEVLDIPSMGIQIGKKFDTLPESQQFQPIYHVGITPHIVFGNDGKMYASLSFQRWEGPFASTNWIETQKSNARLIASAPELLEACIHAQRIILQGNDLIDETTDKVLAELKHAITKAEGTTN